MLCKAPPRVPCWPNDHHTGTQDRHIGRYLLFTPEEIKGGMQGTVKHGTQTTLTHLPTRPP